MFLKNRQNSLSFNLGFCRPAKVSYSVLGIWGLNVKHPIQLHLCSFGETSFGCVVGFCPGLLGV